MAVFGAYKYRVSPTRLKLSLELRFFCHFQEIHSASWLLFISTTRWFGFRLDLLCAIPRRGMKHVHEYFHFPFPFSFSLSLSGFREKKTSSPACDQLLAIPHRRLRLFNRNPPGRSPRGMTGLPLLSSIVIKYFYKSCFVI